jgi:hypothetical protein
MKTKTFQPCAQNGDSRLIMAHPIVHQIVDRLHVSAADDEAVQAVKKGMKKGAWDKLDAETRAQLEHDAVAVHRANRQQYAWVMGSH